MNKAQVIGIIVPLIVGGSTEFVNKLGINTADWTKDVTEGITVLIAVGALVYQHFFHKNTTVVSTTTGVVKSGS